MTPDSLIHRYLSGEASADDVAELDRLLAKDPALRKKLVFEAGVDANLREVAFEETAAIPLPPMRPKVSRFQSVVWTAMATAAVVMLTTFAWAQVTKPKVIAKLVSAEGASWESSLPTLPGSKLVAGELKLNTGLAQVRFKSGVEVTLEAPARLRLETPMKARMLEGVAVVDVPKGAEGFVMEAPGGYAVDFGTKFSVSVDESGGIANFEVLRGEIEVHHEKTGKEVRLIGAQGASLEEGKLVTFASGGDEPVFTKPQPSVRVGTRGRASYVIRNNWRKPKHIHPEFLMVKETASRDWDMRALLHFDVSKVNLESMESVALRLNQVPSGLGLASRLPMMNRFAIYGLPGVDADEWLEAPRWEHASIETGAVKLGTFEIERSTQRGMLRVSTPEMLEFFKSDADGLTTVVLVRETQLIEGEGPGLFHAFAHDSHPEASGPKLEFHRSSAP